ncbi:MAG: hypothetical protein JNL70_13520 [Saprospiraceae bacterium]|nr:hypothetical protein [Saprospiraceae bacterium]
MLNTDLQTYLFDEVKTRYFSTRSEMIEALRKLFNVKNDAIYRRLRGETLLTPEEIVLLAQTYKISLDSFIFQRSDALFFTFNPFIRTVKTIEDYLEGIHQDLLMLNRLPQVHIYNAWAEIPFFFYMFFPRLFSLKMYVFGRTIWQLEHLQKTKFDFDIIPLPMIQKSQEILKLYRNLPTTELWSLNLMGNTLNQIEYHVNSGGFKNLADALVLCQDMYDLVNHMEAMTAHNKKFPLDLKPEGSSGGGMVVYHNEMTYTSNTIYVTSSVGRTIYTTYGNPNFLKTSDERMCDYTTDWFNSVMQKSQNLQSERSRKYFFDNLRKRVDIVRNRIDRQLKEDDEVI